MKRLILSLFILTTFAFATTINVPTDYSTIQAGINAASNGDTVLVAVGTYVENINFNGKSIALIGDSRDSTIIDGNQSGSVITIENYETPEIKGFTITNGLAYQGGGIYTPSASPILKDLFITNNQAQTHGGGLYHSWDGTDFSELIVTNNQAGGNGGGLWLMGSQNNSNLVNILVCNNSAVGWGGGIYSFGADININHITVSNNSSNSGGGALFIYNGAEVEMNNSILWNNSPEEIYLYETSYPNSINISYSIVKGGEADIQNTNTLGSVTWGNGNSDDDPSFIDTSNVDYHLSNYSPAIGAGTTTEAPNEDIEGNPRPNPSGTNPDIGAYENSYGVPQYQPQALNVPTDYSTIQAALTAANATDTVLVQPGTYTENIIWPNVNSIKLISAGDSSNTIINPASPDDIVINIQDQGDGVVLDTTTQIIGFTISGSNNGNGIGISLNGASPSLNKIQLINHSRGIDALNSNFVLLNSQISNCMDSGVYISSGAWIHTKIENTIFTGNTGNRGAGLYSKANFNAGDYNRPSLEIINSKFISNNATHSGGAIHVGYRMYAIMKDILINKNTAVYEGGGIFFDRSFFEELDGDENDGTFSNDQIYNLTITNNHAGNWGGGIYFSTIRSFEFNAGIKKCVIANNSALGTTVWNDSTMNNGGGIYLTGSYMVIDSSVVSDNIGGGIFSDWYFQLNLTNSSVVNNTGGGIMITENQANWPSITTPRILKSTITNNSEYGILGNFDYVNDSNIMSNVFGINLNGTTYLPATNNFWGHSTGPQHPTQNPSGQGDSVSTFVNVDPWLTTPNTDAPPIPAQNTTVTSTGNDFISLNWDASEIGDLAGYKLYYDSDSSGYPYTNSVDIGTDTSYTLSSLTLGTTYYLTVTTYDTDGNESWYSNEVTGTTRVLQTQNLDIGGDEDLQNMVSHIPIITFGYYDSMNETQTNYQVQVSTDSTFSSANMWDAGSVSSDTTSVTYAGTALVDGTTYYLRVRVASGDFWSDWSALSFRMNTEPTTPVLVFPINNQVSGAPVGLKVLNATDAEGDAITYSFNVYSDGTLTTKLDSVTAVAEGTDTTSWQVTGSLPDNGQYFWTVSTNDGYEESAVSDAGSFLLNTDNNAPEAFTLSMPLVDTEVQNLSPVFSWHPANDPDPIDTVYYKLILDTPDPGVVVFEVGTDTSFQVTNPLMDNTEYFWQVMAEDVIGFQTISEGGYQTFYTNVSNDPPSISTLVAPLNGSIQTDLTPNFYWTEAVDPDPMDHVSYTMNWWPLGVLPYINSINTDSTGATPDEDIPDNAQFGWMVVANDMHDSLSLSSSDTSYFYSDAFPEPPLNFATVSPENNVEGLAAEVEFVWEKTDDPDPIEEISYRVVYASDWEDSSTYVYSETIEDTSMGIMLTDNSQYYWLVEALDSDGFIIGSNDNTPNTIIVGTLSIDEDLMPVEFALHQNYPNPFNPVTTMRYDLPDNAIVTITIYDMMGRQVKTLVNQTQDAGYRSIIWDATNDYGKPVSAGIYLYQIQAGEYMQTKKMVLLK